MELETKFSPQIIQALESVSTERLAEFLGVPSTDTVPQEQEALLKEVDAFRPFKSRNRQTSTEIIRQDRERVDGRNLKPAS